MSDALDEAQDHPDNLALQGQANFLGSRQAVHIAEGDHISDTKDAAQTEVDDGGGEEAPWPCLGGFDRDRPVEEAEDVELGDAQGLLVYHYGLAHLLLKLLGKPVDYPGPHRMPRFKAVHERGDDDVHACGQR